jgi:hypothetical protein
MGDSVRIIKTRYAAFMGDMINEYRNLVEKPEGDGNLRTLRQRKNMLLQSATVVHVM